MTVFERMIVGLLIAAAGDGAADVAVGRADVPIRLDGVLDESAWAQAPLIEQFHQVEPIEFAAPSEVTRVRLLINDEAVYIGADVLQEHAPIIARQLVQGRDLSGDDQLTVLLDPYGFGRQGYAFSVNPNGIRYDAIIENSDDFNADWQDIWDAAVVRRGDGWSVEIRIPLKSLTFPAGKDSWGINISRQVAARNETLALSSADRRVDLTTAVVATGFGAAQPGAGVDVVVTGVARRLKDFEGGVTRDELEPSIDVFYQWTPSLTAALTLNTDFSAAEVDQREVNLTRFDLFFPERRGFFLQDANVFEFGGIEENGLPYFSRRIGLGEEGQPLDLHVGARLSGRVDDWGIGALIVQQDRETDLQKTELAVARTQVEVSDFSAVGGILTYGNPVTGDADMLWGVDYRYINDELLDEQELEAFAWYQRFDPESGAADAAWGATLAWPNDTIDAAVGVIDIGDDFAPPLGFVNRAGIRQLAGEFTVRFRPDSHGIRTIDVGIDSVWVDDQTGQLESRLVEVSPFNVSLDTGDEFEITHTELFERLDETFEVVDDIEIEPGRYRFDRTGIEINTAPFRPVFATLAYSTGSFYDGDLDSLEVSLTASFSKHFALGADFEEDRLDLPAGKADIQLVRLLATVAFNAEWSWTNLAQYDSESRELGVNSRLRWIPRAGQEGFIVINHGAFRDEFDRFQSVENEFVVKFGYTFRF